MNTAGRAPERPRLGIVGLGEVGRGLCQRAGRRGLAPLAFVDGSVHAPPFDRTFQLQVAGWGGELAKSWEDLIARAGVIVSVVTPAAAVAVARRIVAAQRGAVRLVPLVLVDANSVAPAAKQRIADRCQRAGILFVEGCLFIAHAGGQGRMRIYLGGAPKAIHRAKSVLTDAGLEPHMVSGPIGTVARLKLLSSVFVKGLAAVCLEAFATAAVARLEQPLFAETVLRIDQEGLQRFMARNLRSSVVHAARRSFEMAAAARVVREMGLSPHMGRAAGAWLTALADLSKADRARLLQAGDWQELTHQLAGALAEPRARASHFAGGSRRRRLAG